MASEPVVVRIKIWREFGYKPLSYKDLADGLTCLVRVNMLLFWPTAKKRADYIALFLHHLQVLPKGLDKNSPKGTPPGKRTQANKVNTSGECFVRRLLFKSASMIPFVFHNYKQVTL